METFRLLLNCVDHYQAIPSDLDPELPRNNGLLDEKSKPKVPVIRVFGATQTGQKVCAHIHGAFPYLYVQYQGSLVSEEVHASIRTLHVSIDHALALSYRRNPYDPSNAYVAYITLVKGIPFYGYHVGYIYYFKIYILNPQHMTRLSDLLLQGAVMKRVIQPYESHLQYIPQWMCDYNLHGCTYINFQKVTFRSPVPSYSELQNPDHLWHDESIPPECIEMTPRQSHCALEVDVHAQDVLNRHEIQPRDLHHTFDGEGRLSSPNEKLVPSLRGLWEDEKRRRKAKMGIENTENSPFTSADLISMSADQRHNSPGGWIHEEEFRKQVKMIASAERQKLEKDMTYNDFLHSDPLDDSVQTALESVKDLYPRNLQTLQVERLQSQPGSGANNDIAEVDENRILSFGPDLGSPDGTSGTYDISDAEPELEPLPDVEDNQTSHLARNTTENTQNARPEPDLIEQPKLCLQPDIYEDSSDLIAVGVKISSEPIQNSEDLFEIRNKYISEDSPAPTRDSSPVAEELRNHEKKLPENHPNTSFSSKLTSPPGTNTFQPGQPEQPAPSPSSQQKFTQSSQLSVLSSGNNQRIQFPVVKDPNGSSTLLRLSQQRASSKTPASVPTEFNGSGVEKEDLSETHAQLASQKQIRTNSSNNLFHKTSLSPLNLHQDFDISPQTKIFSYSAQCPSPSYVRETISEGNRSSCIYQEPYYSNDIDVPERAREYAGRQFRLESNTLPYLPLFDPLGRSSAIGDQDRTILDQDILEAQDINIPNNCSIRVWEFAPLPPSGWEVAEWAKENAISTTQPRNTSSKKLKISQIEGPTKANKHGFKYSQRKKSSAAKHAQNYMTIMSLEVHVNTRGALAPNPEKDEITCVFWHLQTEDGDPDSTEEVQSGIIAVSDDRDLAAKLKPAPEVSFEELSMELDLLNRIIDIVRQYDPDILTGYEVHNSSWGYLIERARHQYDYDLCDEFSRVISQSHGRFGKAADKWGFNHTSSIRVTGRHMINIWRAMRGELNLLQYTMENVVFHLLHKRIPHYPFSDLTRWFTSERPKDIDKVIKYFLSRTALNLKILDVNELVSRTSEQARVLGIDFYSVISRGSQFKVESLMFRIAKPENFILISPSKKQVGQQNALECIPLVMEPQSDFYTSPLLVLDFQSLYPSIMIAYNYCYSTNLGRVVNWRGKNKMGVTNYDREPGLLGVLKDKINFAPNGMIYVKQEVRTSLLARMLTEILETRIMVKCGMKEDKDDRALQRLLNNRQLALKLIANVTYGYTSASFSGRMPCAEIADSIVQTARETLEKAIAMIHSVKRWNAEVVYGDTDSLFVYLKGRSRDEAFDIGEDIAKTITGANPQPVKLKFEKVYHPCVLLAKKRYVGYKYESRNQKEPEFDAKGIETVRRDGTPAEQKIEEKVLRMLFETSDLSQIKQYFQEQCTKIMQGKVSVQDFCFAKEVKLGTYSDRGNAPPGALISSKRMLEDPRLEPQYGERVPYVVAAGAPGARLIDRCVAPEDLLKDPQMELDAEYYISKNIIPPLERIFNLVGANVRQWYEEMPKYQRMRRTEGGTLEAESGPSGGGSALLRKTMESYMKSSSCVVCGDKLSVEELHLHHRSGYDHHPMCATCSEEQPQLSLLKLQYRIQKVERKVANLHDICRTCMGVPWGEEVKCDSKDCPVFYSRMKQSSNLRNTRAVLGPVIQVLEEENGEEDEEDSEDDVMMDYQTEDTNATEMHDILDRLSW
ncbi:DNA polymerase zeta [Myotisia sp. PD_48]|nr:DNA polymerase zeta [Myotisia sp. PD_48]